MELEYERLLNIGAISRAKAGKCLYGSRTVFVLKKEGSASTCVDYRNRNADTEKDLYPLLRFDKTV